MTPARRIRRVRRIALATVDAATDLDTVRVRCCAPAQWLETCNALHLGYACNAICSLRYTSSSLRDVLAYRRFLLQRGCVEMRTRGA